MNSTVARPSRARDYAEKEEPQITQISQIPTVARPSRGEAARVTRDAVEMSRTRIIGDSSPPRHASHQSAATRPPGRAAIAE